MNDNFDNQKDALISISQEIKLLQQQISYLLRNQKELGLLDLDVLMNRTHTIYDMLCSINLGGNEEEEDLDIDPDALTSLFGGMMQGDEQPETLESDEEEEVVENDLPEAADEVVEDVNEEEIPEPVKVTEPVETAPEYAESNVEMPETENDLPEAEIEEEQPVEPEVEEPIVEDTTPDSEHQEIDNTEPDDAPFFQPEIKLEIENGPESVEEEESPKEPDGDEFGLFFRFEDIPPKEEIEEAPVETPQDEVVEDEEGRTVHIMAEVSEEDIPERDLVDGEHLVHDDPFVMPAMDDEPDAQGYGDYFEHDDMDFEIAGHETLGEKMMEEDHSLAAKFQQQSARDLKSFIGLNDKFLFVNELFGGSMEEYNKSIENLNDVETLRGAKTYLDELKVKMQWNGSNEAYQKLVSLINKKFNV